MARTCANAAVHTLSGRKALAPRSAPHWRAIRQGLRIGYRRREQDATGTWLARLAQPSNRILERVLGAADDHPARADGKTVLSYAQAVDKAQDWARTADTRPKDAPTASTVKAALVAYRDAKAEAQPLRAAEVATMLRRHLPDDLASTRASELTSERLRGWLAGMRGPKGERLSQDRLDGLAGIMGAALRATRALPPHVVTEGLGAAAVGAARGTRDEAADRNVVLAREQVAAVLRAAADDEDFGLFVAILDASGLRPAQVAACRVADFDAKAGVLVAPRSAKGKPGVAKKGACHVPLTSTLVARVGAYIAALKLQQRGLIFARAEVVKHYDPETQRMTWTSTGERRAWGKTAWGRAWNATAARCAAAGTPLPDDATIYCLRHTRLTALIDGGLSLREVAARADTSVQMLERTYAKKIALRDTAQDRVRAMLEAEEAAL